MSGWKYADRLLQERDEARQQVDALVKDLAQVAARAITAEQQVATLREALRLAVKWLDTDAMPDDLQEKVYAQLDAATKDGAE